MLQQFRLGSAQRLHDRDRHRGSRRALARLRKSQHGGTGDQKVKTADAGARHANRAEQRQQLILNPQAHRASAGGLPLSLI